MKTTIEILDGLFRRAKALAASDGITLKPLMSEALRQRVGQDAQGTTPRWRALAGELGDLATESRRIDRAIAKEFETVDEDER